MSKKYEGLEDESIDTEMTSAHRQVHHNNNNDTHEIADSRNDSIQIETKANESITMNHNYSLQIDEKEETMKVQS